MDENITALVAMLDGVIAEREAELANLRASRRMLAGEAMPPEAFKAWDAATVERRTRPELREAIERRTYQAADGGGVVDTEHDERDRNGNDLSVPVEWEYPTPHPQVRGRKYPYRAEETWRDCYRYARTFGWVAFSQRDVYGPDVDELTYKAIGQALTRMANDPLRMLAPSGKSVRGVYIVGERFRRSGSAPDMTYAEARIKTQTKEVTS